MFTRFPHHAINYDYIFMTKYSIEIKLYYFLVTINNNNCSPGMSDAEKSVDSLRGRPLFGAGGGAAEGVTSWSAGQVVFSFPVLSPAHRQDGSSEWRRRMPVSEGP